ncbi:MAG: beta-Ala-His dipeptidase [Clostridia bacterium]|nr:beta-Ala-His dipeptidase [Clostridia bacterium]
MKQVMDWNKPYCRYFEELTRIPHGSGNEKGVSDWLVAFAKDHGFDYTQYDCGNVIIRKPATAGYEDRPPMVLQGHMDMVCEKTPDSEHDFTKDALDLYIEDGQLRARGTTLGADDGVGCAYMLAALDDKTMPHPALECIFTVGEEVGLIGAFELNPEDIKGRRMVSMDDCGGGLKTTVSAAGGSVSDLNLTLTCEAADADGYCLKVGGLAGGHSGEQIHQERQNAIKAMTRILNAIGGIRLSTLCGGEKDNAIPRDCAATFTADRSVDEINAVVEKCVEAMRTEHLGSPDDLKVTVEPCKIACLVSKEDSARALDCLSVLPDGVRHHSMVIEGLTTASANLASVRLNAGAMNIKVSMRGNQLSFIEETEHEMEVLARCFGAKIEFYGRYPAWPYAGVTPNQQLLAKVVKEQMNVELETEAIHPAERLDLKSFDDCYALLQEILRQA